MNRLGKVIRTLVALASLTWAGAAVAQTVEVAPGVQVTKKTFPVPINEAPFFGFADKTPEQRSADERFVTALVQAVGSRQAASVETIKRGWSAINSGNVAEAAQRFNQAFLLAPEQSAVYHGYAAVVQIRFNDFAFADELFRVARKQPNPSKNLNADYGRFLLIAARPRDAQPVLEQAVTDAPDFADAWSNLAFARVQNGDRAAACAAAEEAAKRNPSANVSRDLALLKSNAQCR
jgi:Tfp pilus assembly protein PilF